MDSLILVDSQNNELGLAPKDICHDDQGILHRAFSIFVFNKKKELLLQKRADSKRLWPGYWSNSCCSHPLPEESNFSASSRRLNQELGIICVDFIELYHFEYQAAYKDQGSENELCFVNICRSDEAFVTNEEEVSETRWITLADLKLEIKHSPEQFTPWLKLELKELASIYSQPIEKMCS